ncbi:MAG: DUF4405 domain-containing protein [Atribacterota bacterium]
MEKSIIRIRGVIALVMFVLMIFMFFTGILLWLATRGVMNNPALWNFASAVHPWTGFLLFALGIIHFSLNRKLFASDLKALRNSKK